MRISWAFILLVAAPLPAFAQATPAAKTVRTIKVGSADQTSGRPLVDLAPDGVPLIDWDLVERVADGSLEKERTEMARLMLAIRDGQWRAMPKRAP